MKEHVISLSDYARMLTENPEFLLLYGMSELLRPDEWTPFRFYERDFGDGVSVLEHRQKIEICWGFDYTGVQLLVFRGTPFFCLRLFTQHIPNSSFKGMDSVDWAAWSCRPENTQRLPNEYVPSSPFAIMKRSLKNPSLASHFDDFGLFPPVPALDHEELWIYSHGGGWTPPKRSQKFRSYKEAEKFLYQKPMAPMVFDDEDLGGRMAPLLPFSNIPPEKMNSVRFAYHYLIRGLGRCLNALGYEKNYGVVDRDLEDGLYSWSWKIEVGEDENNAFYLWGNAVQTKDFLQVVFMGKSRKKKPLYWLVMDGDDKDLEFKIVKANESYPKSTRSAEECDLLAAVQNVLCIPARTTLPLPKWDRFDELGERYVEDRS